MRSQIGLHAFEPCDSGEKIWIQMDSAILSQKMPQSVLF